MDLSTIFLIVFSRIYAAFIPSLLFVLLIDFINVKIDPSGYAYSEAFDFKNFIGNVFMLQDYPLFGFSSEKIITSFGSARPFWTLAIEWWIYLWFGFIILILLEEKIKLKNLIILAFLSVIPLYNLLGGRGNSLTMYWVLGAMIYLVLNFNILKDINKSIKLISLLVLVCIAGLRAFIEMDAYDPVFAFILAVSLWFWIDLSKEQKIPENISKIIKFNASFSFTLYLVHYSVLNFIYVQFYDGENGYLMFTTGFITSNLVSVLIGRLTEIKLTKKVKHWMYLKLNI